LTVLLNEAINKRVTSQYSNLANQACRMVCNHVDFNLKCSNSAGIMTA